MEWINQLQEAVGFMEAHLLEDINYEDVARWVHMSGYSFHRTFSLMSGMTANEYIRCRRLSLAAQELQQTDISVIDAALKYGYETPESFSKAFSRFHGSTPRQAKSGGAPLRIFNPLVIRITLEGGTAMDYRIVKEEKQAFLALVRSFPCSIINDDSDHSIPDFWGENETQAMIGKLVQLRSKGRRDIYGLCSPKRDDDDTFRYGIGILVDGETDADGVEQLLAQGCTLWETEPAEYVVFKCMGNDGDCISETWAHFFREFLPGSGYDQTELTDYEIYRDQGEEGLFCELWIPVAKK
ncbi:MAG: AraC family transcriptional regulator [Ruminococcaceae bacterium]|nr:AraC family transcriptional regulator [Oscillospiraceae bacterium]